tara:strand:- start:2 stop:301 length:300 start_codon:yes stop_codon:yes gene_type:complete
MINTLVIGGQYTDPTEYNGPEVNWCKRCQSDEIYEHTHVCETCLDELEEMDTRSSCCDAEYHSDLERCYECKEWTTSMLDDECIETGLNPKTFKYESSK